MTIFMTKYTDGLQMHLAKRKKLTYAFESQNWPSNSYNGHSVGIYVLSGYNKKISEDDPCFKGYKSYRG